MPILFLSDHHPFIFENEKTKLLSLNMMFKMKFISRFNFFNNGFKCRNESAEQYKNRIKAICLMMAQQRTISGIDIFCLQEAPQERNEENYLLRELDEKLEKKFNIVSSQGNKNGHYSLTVYNNRRFERDSKLSETISHIRYSGGFDRRVLPVVLIDKTDRRNKHLILNIHANFKKQIKDDLVLLLSTAKQLNIQYVTVIGDFNRNLLIESGDEQDNCKKVLAEAYRNGEIKGINLCNVRNTCVYFSDSGLEIQTRDGAIATDNLGKLFIKPLWNANQVEALPGKLSERFAIKASLTPEIKTALEQRKTPGTKPKQKRKLDLKLTTDENPAKKNKQHLSSGQPTISHSDFFKDSRIKSNGQPVVKDKREVQSNKTQVK